jgi:ectoine hydroxylase-related dioxygenase (phytanoyl-CoA dioxygenase family)
MQASASDALGEPAVAFKDKLNYKQPGGAGYGVHQDKVAYPGAGRVASILVAIDDCSVESGCLWLAGGVREVLPVDDRGVVRADASAGLEWFPAELAAGDAVVIDGLAPHYSQANDSTAPRRVFIASYAPTSEGYDRAHYYGARRERMLEATEQDGRFRISTLADFEGTEVASESPSDVCTHS